MTAASDRDTGTVVWITGLSGAGKSSVARLLRGRWLAAGRSMLLLDGDVLRAVYPGRSGYGREERLELALSYGRLCREIASQGIDVACATISMQQPVYEWNRNNISNYLEVYLRVTNEELAKRDSKGLYRRDADRGATDVYGIDLAADEPTQPTLVIDNEGDVTAERAAGMIFDTARRLGCV